MAAKKVNPELLGKLARIDAAQKAPKTPSAADFRKKEEANKAKMKAAPTPPPVPTPPTTIPTTTTIFDASKLTPEEEAALFTTTTTTVPKTTTTTTTTVPAQPKPYGKPNEKVSIGGMSVTLDKDGNVDVKRYPYAAAIVADIRAREADLNLYQDEKPKDRGFWSSWVGKTVVGAANNLIVKPLNVIDAPRRVIISGIKEGVDAINAGDASWSDFINQSKDSDFGFGDVVQTGNKWVDRAIGFVGDVALDPTTYLTLGTGTAAKMALKGVTREVSQELIEKASKIVIAEGVEAVEEKIAKQLTKELGDLSKKEIRTYSRAIVSEATQTAYSSATTAAEKAAAKAARNTAIKRYSAVAPRRQLGAKTKEAMADGIRQLREEALQEAKDFAGTAAGRRAKDFADAITDDVISDIATRGYAGIRGAVADQLGVKGGFRFGAFSNKVYLGGGRFTDAIGTGVSKVRLKPLQAGGLVGRGSRGISNLITGRGEGGLFGSADIWDWRTGLKQGTLTGKEGVRAVELLGEDAAYRAAQKAAVNSTNAAFRVALNNKAYKPYYNTVHELLSLDDVALGATTGPGGFVRTAQDVADELTRTNVFNRPIAAAEVEFAQDIRQAVEGLAVDLDSLAEDLGGSVVIPAPDRWYPQTLDNRTSAWLRSNATGKKGLPGTSPKEVLAQLGLDRAPIAGDEVGKGLKPKDIFFGVELSQADIDGGIARLNEIARQRGYKGNFFEVNIASALNRYASKYGRDYAFLRRMLDNAYGDMGVTDFTSPAGAGAYDGIGKTLPTSKARPEYQISMEKLAGPELDNILRASLDEWDVADIEKLRNTLQVSLSRTLSNPKVPQAVKDASREAAAEFDKLLNQLDIGLKAGYDLPDYLQGIADPWYASTMMGIIDDYSGAVDNWTQVLARNKNALLDSVKNLSPATLQTMANMAEDAFVKLGADIAPDAYVRADIAQFYQNIRRLKDPRQAGPIISFMKDYTNAFKTWVTTTPGFHLRNVVSNAWQMVAAGGDPRYLMEGRRIYKDWTDYLKVAIDNELGMFGPGVMGGGLTPNMLVDDFIVKSGMSKSQASAFRDAILRSGAITEGDLVDVFRSVTPGAGRTGITGKEIRTDISKARQKVSQIGGYLPAVSRSFGDNIEKANRFMLTYDGIKQGYGPQEAAARTARFLVDYEDLSKLDEVAKQIIPFWMWMSRNLPVQLTNIYANPGAYQKYNNFRRNFEDEEGTNPLLPDWLKESGAFKLPIPGRFYGRPDLGFPGTGSPSPLVETVGDISSITQGMNPALRVLLEQVVSPILNKGEAQQIPTGIPFESTGERVTDVAKELLSPASWLGRTASAAIPGIAQSNVPGPQWIQDVLGITGGTVPFKGQEYEKEGSKTDAWINALSSYLGIPLRRVGANEENQARREILRALEDYLDKYGKYSGK